VCVHAVGRAVGGEGRHVSERPGVVLAGNQRADGSDADGARYSCADDTMMESKMVYHSIDIYIIIILWMTGPE
jgi:hypothetical protein